MKSISGGFLHVSDLNLFELVYKTIERLRNWWLIISGWLSCDVGVIL